MASFLIGSVFNYFTGTKQDPSPVPETTNPSRPCRFQLDSSTSGTFALPDGRKIGYAEFGTPAASDPHHTVISLHGLPGSRLEGAFAHDIANELSTRVILVERPGHGLSDPNPGWTILSHARDVSALADHLGLETYGVTGTSGGGPYALACAYICPAEKLLAVTVVAGMGELSSMRSEGMAWLHYLGYGCGYMRLARAVSHWLVTGFFKFTEPGARMDLSEDERVRRLLGGLKRAIERGVLHEREVQMWKRNEEFAEDLMRLSVRSNAEIWSTTNGCEAVTMDGANLSDPWGYRLEDVRPELHISLWYGEKDVACPASHGRQITQRLEARGGGKGRKALKTHFENETHISLQFNFQEQIWTGLIESMAAAEADMIRNTGWA